MEINNLKSAFEKLSKFDYFAKEDDYIEVTEWKNGEGFDIRFINKQISLSYGELDGINYLIQVLKYEK